MVLHPSLRGSCGLENNHGLRGGGVRVNGSGDELPRFAVTPVSARLLISRLRPMIGRGLAAAVYTQTSDCEGEVNGLMTYDREVVKFDLDHMRAIHAPLFLPPPIIITKVILPTSEKTPQTWRYKTDQPKDGWETVGFDDSSWKETAGGFGRKDTPGAVVRTDWHSSDIWLRRTLHLESTDWNNVHLRIHHDEDAEIYLNGKLVASYKGYLTEYEDMPLNKDAQAALRVGENTLAVHCRQTGGGQYIDVGLVDVIEKPRTSP